MDSNFNTILNKFLIANSNKVLLGVTLVSIFTLIVFIIVSIKLSKMIKRYDELMKGVSGGNLEDMILSYAKTVNSVKTDVKELSKKSDILEKELGFAVNKVYSKRYNAFPDMGSDLSFSLVLLNSKNTGVIITSIYGRDENRVYLKPVKRGECSYTLSPEEQELLYNAIKSETI